MLMILRFEHSACLLKIDNMASVKLTLKFFFLECDLKLLFFLSQIPQWQKAYKWKPECSTPYLFYCDFFFAFLGASLVINLALYLVFYETGCLFLSLMVFFWETRLSSICIQEY